MKKALLVLLILSVGFAGGWVVSGVSQNGRDKSKDNNAPPVATKSTERDKAEVLWQYDSQLTPELYALQKNLGYAHH